MAFDRMSMCFSLQDSHSQPYQQPISVSLSSSKKLQQIPFLFTIVASSEKPWIAPITKTSEDSKVLPPQTGNCILFFKKK